MTRTLLLIAVGCLAAAAISWFVRLAYDSMTGGQLVITPFHVVGPNAQTPGYGDALAGMLESRLAKIERDLSQGGGDWEERFGTDSLAPNAKPLLITQTVEIPAELRKRLDFQARVGGVEVGPIMAWLRDLLYQSRTVTITLVEKEGEPAVMSANLSALISRGDPHLWLSSAGGPDEITTNLAYAMVQRKLADQGAANLAALDLPDFRLLIDGLVRLERLNEKARQNHLVDQQFAELLADLESLHAKIPSWQALTFLMGNLAESSGNRQRALFYYHSLKTPATPESGPGDPLDDEIGKLVQKRLAALGHEEKPPETVQQMAFVKAAREFARRMALSGPEVSIGFRRFDLEGQQGQWNSEERRYEVNVDQLSTPGLPQYVALTGRFMVANLERCKERRDTGWDWEYWNEFRYSVVDYLIRSVPDFSEVEILGHRFVLFRVLKRLEQLVGKEPVQRIALEMLDRYDCDWSEANIEEHVRAIVNDRGLAPMEAVAEAFRNPIPEGE